ncbi:hypothetical protein SDC9_199088 [bioreactor metagenome]|uniref:Uncharacterized protein n=1 Tax=bioreactor metagenome TaxID=1076179 RepID=A0A645IKR2_9ZZZZ
MRRAFIEALHSYKTKRGLNLLWDDLPGSFVIFESKRNIVIDNRGDKLVVRVLKNHTAFASQLPYPVFIARIDPGYGQLSVLKPEQRVEVLHKR